MRTTTTMTLLVLSLAACIQAAAPRSVTQPTKIPGDWEMRADTPMPALAEIVAKPAAKPPVYGLYSWCGEYRNNRQSNIRIAGPVDDETVRMLVTDGIDVMVTLGVHVTGQKRQRPDYDSDEAFIAAYVKAVEAFLTRYGPGGTFFAADPKPPSRPIKAIEIWNEPNFQYMIPNGRPRAQVEAAREALYAKLLPATYAAVKARWPDVTVVGFGAGGASAGDIRFFQHVHALSPKVGGSYDVLSTHPYSRPAPPEAWSVKRWGAYNMAANNVTIRKIMAANGAGSKPIWYTEIGWPISQADGGHFPDRGSEPKVSPLLQAAYVCRTYAMAMRLGVERVNIMFVTDSDGFNGGFFLRDKSWRPSAYAVQHMIRLMPNPKLTAAIHDGDNGLYAYVLENSLPTARPSKRTVIMAWNVAGPKTVTLPVDAVTPTADNVRVVDLFGNAKTVAVTDGKVQVEVGPCPVYIRATRRR